MHRLFYLLGILTLLLCWQAVPSVTAAPTPAGPLGLQWGMSKEAVEQLGIGLCCRQVGKYGARYEVASEDFSNFPNPLGDEAKVYLYFGNANTLLRIYIAIHKVDGWNRYKQLMTLVNENHRLVRTCQHKQYDKYESLKRGKTAETCQGYESYAEYVGGGVEVFVWLQKKSGEYEISIAQLNQTLYDKDKKKKSPL